MKVVNQPVMKKDAMALVTGTFHDGRTDLSRVKSI